MTDKLQFTDEEIRMQLELLGFRDVSVQQLQYFKNELQELLEVEKLRDQNVGVDNAAENTAVVRSEDDAKSASKVTAASTHKHHSNVMIEKLPVDAFDRYKFRSRLEISDTNKENSDRLVGELRETGTEMDAYSCTSKDSDTNSDIYNKDIEQPSDISSTSSNSLLRKRKVLRKKNGKVKVEITGPVVENRQLKEIYTSEASSSPPSKFDDKSDSATSNPVPKRWRSISDLGITKRNLYRSKSVLLPYTNNTQAHVYYKSDPVALFHYYKREWSNFNIPGEKNHRELRWNIRQALSTGFGPTSSSSSTTCRSKSGK